MGGVSAVTRFVLITQRSVDSSEPIGSLRPAMAPL